MLAGEVQTYLDGQLHLHGSPVLPGSAQNDALIRQYLLEPRAAELRGISQTATTGRVSIKFSGAMTASAERLGRALAQGEPTGNLLKLAVARGRCIKVAEAAAARLEQLVALNPLERLHALLSLFFSRDVQIACHVPPQFLGVLVLFGALGAVIYLHKRTPQAVVS